jgi:pimeloyl-ACP methyl ester carboxylesterase
MTPTPSIPQPPAAGLRRRPFHALLGGLWLAAALGFASVPQAVQAQQAPTEAPSVTAVAGVTVHDFTWHDVQRDRVVPARLYWPSEAAEQALPLVVFSHGLGGSRLGYSHLGRHWAAQGYASLHLQHAGSDRAVWTGGAFSLLGNLQAAASDANAIARARDVSFGISTLLAEPAFGTRIDAARIAVAGHSYGANTALLVAGARLQREVDGEWRSLDFRDPRVKAAILLSTPPFYREGDVKAILSPIDIPTLHLTGTKDVIRIPGYRSEPPDRIAVFDAVPAGPDAAPKVLAVFSGGTHNIFTDRIDAAGPELNRAVKAATREISTRFLDASLRGASFKHVSQWLDRQGDLLAQQTAVSLPLQP